MTGKGRVSITRIMIYYSQNPPHASEIHSCTLSEHFKTLQGAHCKGAHMMAWSTKCIFWPTGSLSSFALALCTYFLLSQLTLLILPSACTRVPPNQIFLALTTLNSLGKRLIESVHNFFSVTLKCQQVKLWLLNSQLFWKEDHWTDSSTLNSWFGGTLKSPSPT